MQVSDLYAMNFKAVVDAEDFTQYLRNGDERLNIFTESLKAYTTGTLTPDVQAEIEKLKWADVLLLQFPLW